MASTPRTRPGLAELIRTASIARRYYFDGRTKSELAEEFRLSRFKIARILEDAVASGIVQISVVLPAELDARLSAEVCAAFGLQRALVIRSTEEDDPALTEHLGHAGAEALAEIVSDGEVLGIPSGRTMTALSAQLTHLARCTVVPLTGVLTSSPMTVPVVELLRRITALSGGSAFPVYTPWVVSDARTAEAFRREPEVADALRRHDYLTTAVVAIGSWAPSDSTLYDALPADEREDLRARGVAAELCGILVDEHGRIVRAAVSDRLVAIDAEQLRRVPHVVAVAGGRRKHVAILAALRTGLVHSLVTDSVTAGFLLDRKRPGMHAGGRR